MNYKEFASSISFFEFIQEEFKNPDFPVDNYKNEFKILKEKMNIDSLVKLFESSPKAFDIFEQIFQLSRFTNTQYINFLFDVNTLNNNEYDSIINYANNSIFKFENGINNEIFNKLYDKYLISENIVDTVLAIKRSITDYIDVCLNKKPVLYNHISNSIGSRYRIAKYFLENLRADELSQAIDFERYLKIKRLPRDTKGIHGKFGTIKISKILEDYQIKDLTNIINYKILPLNKSLVPTEFKNNFSYVREKKIENIKIRKTKKEKVFDFIILHDGIPALAIETNFYSTSGTKIGINVGEYTDLNEDIKNVNELYNTNIKFGWISDGNFWLTNEGEKLFENLKNNYFNHEYELMNYNYFRSELTKILYLLSGK